MESLSRRSLIILVIASFTFSCKNVNQNALFTLVEKNHSHIDFINKVDYTEDFNTYTYRNFYNGAGVGIGDFNNDDLPDIYFCGNMVDNRLYINKGNFTFEDITMKAGVGCHGSWSTGVSIADINGDGFLDIYICKSGKPDSENRRNELFINNGNLTFSEKAKEYGLDILGLSNHASFFDYDRDGDLDCYLLNNSFQSVTQFDIQPGQREIRDTSGANMLFRNDNGHFTDVSSEAGIYGSKIGFGLGVSISDLNHDGFPDIYVANDFFERDYLYINKGDGTFRESLEEQLREISLGAMGADIADLNNDACPEIFVTEMTPEDFPRFRTKAVFEGWEEYNMKVRNGYYHQFPRNTLQLNNRNNTFSEIGRFSNISVTDWSWGALIFDFDNDGWKDIFVANGIFKDLLDRDFLDIYSNPSVMRTMIRTEEKAILRIIDQIPSVKIPNYAFHSNKDLTFTNMAEEYGLGTPSWSNGAAYGDLDSDGDLDLIVNNVNMEPFLYRNESAEKENPGYIALKLIAEGNNCFATGSCVTVYYNGQKNYQELFPCRGFMSTSDNRLFFGLGNAGKVDSIAISWPNGKCSVVYSTGINRMLSISESDTKFSRACLKENQPEPVFKKPDDIPIPSFRHTENDFNDFKRDKLIFSMVSNEGPRMAIDDCNNDGLADIFICNSKDSPGDLLLQDKNGKFRSTNKDILATDKISEDTDCAFFDADSDGDKDLYVSSGGNEYPATSSALTDRLYLNDAKGNLVKSINSLPGDFQSNSCVEPEDFDNDGDIDLFIGTRLIPFSYGLPPGSYLLENDGKGNFVNITASAAKDLTGIGMVTDMSWADIDNDNDKDMIIAGEWMQIKILSNEHGIFRDISEQCGLKDTEGFWHRVIAKDLNNDGYVDFVLGNNGLNYRFKASKKTPLSMYVNDFDLNGSIEQIICWSDGVNSFPLEMKDDLVSQIPSLGSKYVKYSDYKDVRIEDMFPPEVLNRSVKLNARNLESLALINKGNYKFDLVPLPAEAQFSPVYAIVADDFNNDGICDIIVGGNQQRSRPESGINDAGYGLFLKGEKEGGWKSVTALESGISVKGEIRDIATIRIKERHFIVIATNNSQLQFYEYR